MSRIGRMPVKVPSGVDVQIDGVRVVVKGPRGSIEKRFHPDMKVTVQGDTLVVERPSEEKTHKSLHGLTRSLLANMIRGVTEGFSKELEIQGTGYRAAKQGNNLVLTVGYSHPVEIKAGNGIEFEVPAPTRITVKGIDKEQVGQVAADIRKVKPPDPYKGKGIRYSGERIRMKAGKTGKA
jgi:large subunit ribosomal protein L6